MRKLFLTMLTLGGAAVAGCTKETPPPSVDEFLENRILLDAAMVRCTRNRSTMKYERECVNAREASNRIARAEDAERRKLLEAQSERKRNALRRAQEAAEQARLRAAEAERQRREAAYLAQFGQVEGAAPASTDAAGQAAGPDEDVGGGKPPSASADAADDGNDALHEGHGPAGTAPTGTDPVPQPVEEPAAGSQGDLDAIREELRRRQEGNR